MSPLQDIRLAIRRLVKGGGATIASVAALGCGIGASVATWSLISAVLLAPLSVEAPDRLFQLDAPPVVGAADTIGHPHVVFEAIRDSRIFDGIAAGGSWRLLVTEQGGVPQSRNVYFANHRFFATLGISAAHGRTFLEGEDRRGAAPVAVLSDRYWRGVFAADPNVAGRIVSVSGTPATIVGILPPGFRGLRLSEAPDLYLPLHVADDIDHGMPKVLDAPWGGISWTRVVGRLRPGETPEAAAARLNALQVDCPACAKSPVAIGPLVLTNVNTAATPLAARADMTQFTTLLSVTVGLLLLIGCVTVGMLLLVRTEDRRDELAVCLALGATRSRLAYGIAVEAAILCALGAVLAVPVAMWLFYGVRAFQLPGNVDIELLQLTLTPGRWVAVTGTALGVTCMIALLANLAGLGSAARSPLRSRALATPRVTRRASRTTLVAGQVAITLVLVAGTGLFTRSLVEALSLNPGLDAERIVTADLALGEYGYTPERAATFIDELRDRLRQNRVIESVSIRSSVGGAQAGVPIMIDGVRHELPSNLAYWAVGENFFATLGLPIVRGRGFERTDTASSPRVAVVSESLGKLVADGGNPIGHRISDPASILRVMMGRGAPDYAEVVGVVPDLITDVNTTQPLTAYFSLGQRPPGTRAALALRAAGDPRDAMREAAATVRALDPLVTLRSVQTLNEQIGRQMNPQRFGISVLGALGGIALLLTLLGTYVMAESTVVRRRREMSIRAALGAGRAQLRRLVLRDTARLVGIGLIAGLALAVLGARLIRSLLFESSRSIRWCWAASRRSSSVSHCS